MIYLIRHGQTHWNAIKKIQGHTDIPLNEQGKKEAEKSAQKLINLNIHQIISSDLLRAKQTAEIINQYIQVPISFDARLRELCYGQLEACKSTEISKETWDIFNTNPQKLNAESFSQLYDRVKDFAKTIDTNQNLLIVTHGGFLRMFMYFIENRQNFDHSKFKETYKNLNIKNTSFFQWHPSKEKILTFVSESFR